jgi:hypothetical protein
MKYRYWGYSTAAFLVWGLILVIFWTQGNATNTHDLLVGLPRMGNRMDFDHHRQGRLSATQTLVRPEDAVMVGDN